jgi:hypothetical protein
MPVKQIAAALGVSAGSVSAWTRDIPLSPAQQERNQREACRARGQAWRERNRGRRLGYQREGRRRAQEGDPLHLAGCMLYWAEGAKCRNVVKFANSDTHLVAFFWRFLQESFHLGPGDLRIHLNVYTNNGLSIAEIEAHWLEALAVSPTCLGKHSLNSYPTSSSGKKRNKLPFGVCSLSVHSTRIVQHIYGAIQEYGGFEEPRWLDC